MGSHTTWIEPVNPGNNKPLLWKPRCSCGWKWMQEPLDSQIRARNLGLFHKDLEQNRPKRSHDAGL